MQYWRMQLHPADPDRATKWAAESLARGLVGFAYGKDPGDLTRSPDGVPKNELEFATGMAVGDRVLVLVHQYPFALVTIDSDYCYLREPPSSGEVNMLGVWFNHFRRVTDVKYYADLVKDPTNWDQSFLKCPTIQLLVDPESRSYKLIQSWP
ncbi:MAG: hypothetical protein EXR98_07655 [Gemmataceae bacterium]|nr:hypothetical protein [Gemmataceae bacterium]